MKINNRLKKIGDLVDSNSLILDIGCDHALLDIYLVKNKIVQKAIASDIKEGPLKHAEENIKKYKLEDKIETRLKDGLDAYTDDVNTVIISGIGGRSIIGMFKYKPKITKKIKTVIVSPNNYQIEVRKFFCQIGFKIVDEQLVKDGNIIYQIIKFQKGKCKYKKRDYFFGPILLKHRNKLFIEYYNKELVSREILLNLLPKNYRLKKCIIKHEIKMIKEVIK